MDDLHQTSARIVRFHGGYGKAIRYDGYELDESLLEEGEILRATAPYDPREGATDKHQDDEGWKADERVRLRSIRLPL